MTRYYLMKQVMEPYRLSEVYRDSDVVLLNKDPSSGRIVPDFMEKPFPLLRDRVKQLFEKMIPYDIYRPCVIVEEPNTVFWEFQPKKVSVEAVQFSVGGDVEAIEDFGLEPFLQVEGVRKTSIVISQMVAESLLRRGYNILELREVGTIGRNKEVVS